MYSILLGASAGILIAIVSARTNARIGKEIFYLDAAVLCGLVGVICGIFLALFLSPFVPREKVISQVAHLVPLGAEDGVSGYFVQGSYKIGFGDVYRFAYKNPNGSISPGEVPGGFTLDITEVPDLHGDGFWLTISNTADTSSNLYPWALTFAPDTYVVGNVLYVPVGTVVQNFSER